MAEAHANPNAYYVPHASPWPIIASGVIFTMFVGGALTLNDYGAGPTVLGLGLLGFVAMLFGWFGVVIKESEGGMYSDQVDVSFRMGMGWFIFSEVMFFAAFFGALYYARVYSVPWLGGSGSGEATNEFLYPGFIAAWPLQQLPESFGFSEFKDTIGAWGVPAWNTAILLTSGVTVTMAHWALKGNKRGPLIGWMAATVALGILFLYFQAEEYGHAYHELGLTLNSGIYGATFFMLTGFHGFHVTMGTIMLAVILFRCMKGHFTPKHHFAFEGVAWYWHFVDVVWLGLFIFVYWI
ncbi:MAG: cytochrome c oxidase subunit 3 [Gammaproteobacteria bacterium]|nr:cytochrome c oxidase subunit 3 [Gammaproteobacteria bacterium]NNM01220.1 cytochrome c oxidase subunit 3 [Gammaproteobacteria bacterium]